MVNHAFLLSDGRSNCVQAVFGRSSSFDLDSINSAIFFAIVLGFLLFLQMFLDLVKSSSFLKGLTMYPSAPLLTALIAFSCDG